MSELFTSTKTYTNLPCAHRQHAHPGHCRFIHGYSRSIKFYFAARELTQDTQFVVDFGDLKAVKQWLEDMFDHTMLINENDPERELFEEMHKRGVCDLRVMPNVGMEGTSKYVFMHVDPLIRERTNGRAWVWKIETRENDKNSAEFEVARDGTDIDHLPERIKEMALAAR